MYAADGGRTEVARALLDAGTDSCSKNGGGWTPLDFARKGKHEELAQLLEAAMKR